MAKKQYLAKIYISASFNNPLVTGTDPAGGVIAWGSSGASGFKGTRKATPFAATTAVEKVIKKAKDEHGVEEVEIYVKGPGPGRDAALRASRLAVPPGVHGPKGLRNPSQYGRQLREKQKVKRLYGVLEKQFRNYVEEALKTRGNTGERLIQLLESRLDNVVFRLGFVPTRPASRQLVGHRHVLVKGKRENIPWV